MLWTVLQLLASGLLLGGVYALLSMGLTLIFGVMRVVNFAHGEFLMLGMFGAFWLWKLYGVDPYISVLLIAPVAFLVAVVVERLVIRPTIGAPDVTQIFATFGLSIFLQSIALTLWTGNYRSVDIAYTQMALDVGRLALPLGQLVSFIIAFTLAVALYIFLQKTYVGKAIRATAQNRTAAYLMGINVSRVYMYTFAIATASVAAAGAVIAPLYSVYPRVGLDFLLVAFVIMVLGGLGSVLGAIVASFLIGIVVSCFTYFFGASEAQLAYFVIFMLVLAFRPSGLFGQRGAEEYEEP
jgi:branched-chain amino acid transport system permease protein